MKLKILFYGIVGVSLLLFSQCSPYSSSSAGRVLTWHIDTLLVRDKSCDTTLLHCSHVLLEYPVFKGDHSDIPNRVVQRRIAYLLGQGEVTGEKNAGLSKLADQFIQKYKAFRKDFPDTHQQWFFRLKTKVNYNEKGIISLALKSVQYTGGAHDLPNTMLLNFDKKTGRFIEIKDRIKDWTVFRHLAEKEFRQRNGLSIHADLNKDGHFRFPHDRFKLPVNMGFGPQGFILFYNVYEIAPYAMGPTRLIIPYGVRVF